jgi:hypothetical protein
LPLVPKLQFGNALVFEAPASSQCAATPSHPPSLQTTKADPTFYFFFFFPVGITLATLLAIELAIFATTPFFDPPFFPFAFDLVPRPFDVAVDLDFELVVFFAAFFAIPDSLTLR